MMSALPVCVSVHHMCFWCLKRSEESVGSLGNEATCVVMSLRVGTGATRVVMSPCVGTGRSSAGASALTH